MLPETVTPIQYDITMFPNLIDLSFSGSEQISINISQTYLHVISIHIGPEMNISLITIKVDGFNTEEPINAIQESYNNETEIISFTFDVLCNAMLHPIATLNIQFHSKLRNDMRGFYISKYTYENVTVYNAVTQFLAIDARRVFPCFDEPSLKARFKIKMIAPIVTTVLSNLMLIIYCQQYENKLESNGSWCLQFYHNVKLTAAATISGEKRVFQRCMMQQLLDGKLIGCFSVYDRLVY